MMKWILAMLAALLATTTPALAQDRPDYGAKLCPAASPSLMGTAARRSVVCWLNIGATDVCIDESASFTCDGTVETDGTRYEPGKGFCVTPTDTGYPASHVHYCRADTTDTEINLQEYFR